MIVVTTITSVLDIDSMSTEHSVEVDDKDGLSSVSGDMLGAVLMGALGSTTRAVEKAYPRVAKIDAATD